MKDHFLRVACMTPQVVVADPLANEQNIRKLIDEAIVEGASIAVFPELSLTGYTCQDLFLQESLLRAALESLSSLAEYTAGRSILAFVGLPYRYQNCLYNVVAAIGNGRVLGLIPKTHIPNYSEYYERRHFSPAPAENIMVTEGMDFPTPFGTHILFECNEMPECRIGVELCEDLWVPNPPSVSHAMNGATILVNSSASSESICKADYRKNLVKMHSGSLVCAYLYADAGEGESTQDLIFCGHNIIAENGTILAESPRYTTGSVYAEIDLERLQNDRMRMTTFINRQDGYYHVPFSLQLQNLRLFRSIDPMPFVPMDAALLDARCEEILTMQAMGLKKRMQHTNAQSAIVGISGGLDSTLALLVTAKAFQMLKMDPSNIIAVTMPCFGTTSRTRQNACQLAEALGLTLKEICIEASVKQHFKDISHPEETYDVVYENSQARERTQVLMDLANMYNGLVIGTGDLSELALGWATYNGDHMSMYAVNASVPKTLVRHLIAYYAKTCKDEALPCVLSDILSTPISPELLPPVNDHITQETECLVGPYKLHDFFLYNVLRHGFAPRKIYRLAKYAFDDEFSEKDILFWLKVFYKRFFSQQYKRSCLPDGPKVGSVTLSPRGDFRMPSDACMQLWLRELDAIENDE